MDSGAEVYGTLVSDIQTDVEVTGKVIIPKTIESPYVSRNVPVKYCNYVDLKKIVGASVVWNQLGFETGYSATTQYSPMFRSSTKSFKVDTLSGHKYLISFIQPLGCAVYRQNRTGLTVGYQGYSAPTSNTKISFLASCTESQTQLDISTLVSKNTTTEEAYNLTNCMWVDLTAMFDTTIADYVYTLETTEAGTGIAWLQSYGFFTEDYYEYTENKIESVCTNGRTSNGITYPISAVELRGLFKLDNGKLTVDGDEYEADGTIKRKYGVVTITNDTSLIGFQVSADYGAYARISGISAKVQGTDVIRLIADKCEVVSFNNRIANATIDRVYIDNSGNLAIRASNSLSISTADSLKSEFLGTTIIYELATPDVDLTIPFNERQKVGITEQFDDYGVITGTRDVSIPVGNETDYLQNFAGQITGTLHYIENGLAPSGYLSGSGNFIALHLDSDDWSRYTSVKVGLEPSQASGMVEILDDEEKIAVGKITDNEQVFIVESTDGEFTKTDVYSLSDLVLETE